MYTLNDAKETRFALSSKRYRVRGYAFVVQIFGFYDMFQVNLTVCVKHEWKGMMVAEVLSPS